MGYLDTEAGVEVRSDLIAVTQVGRGPGRRGGAETPADADSALEAGLQAAGFEIATVLNLAPPDSPARRSELAAAELAVAVASDEDALLLIHAPGDIYSWRLPSHREEPPGRRSAASNGKAVFLLNGSGDPEGSRDRRGPVSDWVVGTLIEPIRTYVLRFAARKTIDFAVDRIEGDMITGPVPIWVAASAGVAGAAPGPAETWTPRPAMTEPGAKVRRILLVVHGTFSSTSASFGLLQATEEGRSFLEEAAANYDLVLGFDHRTLAETPSDNAARLLDALAALPLDKGCALDAIAFSRGGLVYRALAEQLLPKSRLDLRLDRAVFVGCTNAGTRLASPCNWLALADVYTNIALAANRGLGLLAAGNASLVAAQVIKTVGRFVQTLPQVAIGERYTPGLAAMEPASELVAALNGGGDDRSAARYHAVTSSFEPSRADGYGMSKRLARFLIDRVADRLFSDANDLVVDTAAMTDFGAGRDWIADDDLHAFGDTGDVFHTVYFGSPEVATALRRWLGPAARTDTMSMRHDDGAGGTIGELEKPEVGVESRLENKRIRMDPDDQADDDGSLFGFKPEEDIPYRHVSLNGGSDPVPIPPTADPNGVAVQRTVVAEMQQYPRLSAPANVFVTVSGGTLASAGHAAAAKAEVALDPGRELVVEVVPTENCRVLGEAKRVVDPAKEETNLRFVVEGASAGRARLLVEARQGDATVASLTLRPEFLDAKEQMLHASQGIAGAPGGGRDAVVLRIYEYTELGRVRSLRFDLQGRGYATMQTLELPHGIELDDHMREVLKEAEAAWNLRAGEDKGAIYQSFMASFADSAKTRTEALLPKEIRAMFWEHREQIEAVQVISENPIIAWELLYMWDPAPAAEGNDPKEGFLAEWGLTRWLHGAPIPDPTLSLDGARSRFVVPAYAGATALPGAEAEREMLVARLPGAAEIEATSLAVVEFLRKDAQDCDVLHFACHGTASSEGVMKGQLAMRGIERDGRTVADPLTIDRVRQNVRFGAGPRRALVFVNACQTGQQGYSLTGATGFADAFLRPYSGQGAAVFVAALWSVDDTLALTFAERLYEELSKGATLAAASKAARVECQTRSDLTWLAYTVYGNPFATVSPAQES